MVMPRGERLVLGKTAEEPVQVRSAPDGSRWAMAHS